MATKNLAVSSTPVNVKTLLALVDDETYLFSNGGGVDMEIADSAASPVVKGHPLIYGRSFEITVDPLAPPWAWVSNGASLLVVSGV